MPQMTARYTPLDPTTRSVPQIGACLANYFTDFPVLFPRALPRLVIKSVPFIYACSDGDLHRAVLDCLGH